MKNYNQFLETPFSEDKKWIQKATKNMRKDKPCTGEKFGSETCPPGSKRYNLAKTFKKMAKEEATPEPPKEDPAMKSKEKRQMQIKKQVLLKKMQAVRAGAGADIVASHTPEGEVLDEEDPRLAIYQSGMTDASRVKGRVGKAVDKVKDKVKKVLGKKDKVSSHLDRYRYQSGLDNYLKSKVKKEEVELDKKAVKEGASKTPDEIRAANRKWLEKRGRKIEQNIKDKKPVKPMRDYGEEVVHEGDVHAGQGEKIQKRTKKWMDKKGQKGAPGLDAMKARTAEHKAKRGVKEDKAFDYVVAKLRKQHGDDAVLTKGQKPKPPTAAQKKKNAEIRAKRAKEDHRDPTEKASSGRYSDRYSNRGSD